MNADTIQTYAKLQEVMGTPVSVSGFHRAFTLSLIHIYLSKYGIQDVKEIIHNTSYDVLFAEETKPGLQGIEQGQVTELGAVYVMTGIYTGRSPIDKFFVMNEARKDSVW